ncbi:MotE family protein [Pelagibacterium lacus]|uniref:Flagellar protein FlbB n=1 Tax=Pelagibacterium lacus TaxID=2282655 RepID=A0A369W8U5_9HYPH|nr:hypothetical protein [Pelagibacterium lacus]RDE10265.1 hypothetical protein DVH29_02440 [Pelagibacterium lacus]
MKQIRLLPVVVVAASALLGLKAVGLVTGAGYTLGGANVAFAVDAPLEAAAEAVFAAVPDAETGGAGNIFEVTATGDAVPFAADDEATGDIILQRLAERRAELDAFAAELETRLAVIEAAELRIAERMAELDALEASVNAGVDARETQEAEQFAALVSMYENMRPADAATIFNDLETGVLVRVGREMNPRKLGPIMAKMLPVKAQELTVLLAQSDAPDLFRPGVDEMAELPQIIGQ